MGNCAGKSKSQNNKKPQEAVVQKEQPVHVNGTQIQEQKNLLQGVASVQAKDTNVDVEVVQQQRQQAANMYISQEEQREVSSMPLNSSPVPPVQNVAARPIPHFTDMTQHQKVQEGQRLSPLPEKPPLSEESMLELNVEKSERIADQGIEEADQIPAGEASQSVYEEKAIYRNNPFSAQAQFDSLAQANTNNYQNGNYYGASFGQADGVRLGLSNDEKIIAPKAADSPRGNFDIAEEN